VKSHKRSLALLAAVGSVLLVIACGIGLSTRDESSKPGPLFTQHQPLTVPSPTKAVGEDCALNGASVCLSGLCLHSKPDKDVGYFCSKTCTNSRDCPSNWQCVQYYPGSDNQACVPPASWVAAVAQ
jgi:hypothetical protein